MCHDLVSDGGLYETIFNLTNIVIFVGENGR